MNIKKTFRLPSFFVLILVGLMPLLLQAQPNPPQIDCASFSNSISTVTWVYQPNVDCNGGSFEEYVIYTSETPEGPFTELVATAAPSPYEHDLNSVPVGMTLRYYYMTIRCGGQESLPSDTLSNRRPNPPSVLNTTVLPDGSVQIAFLPVPDAEITGYLLIRTEDGQEFNTVEGVPSLLGDLTIVNDTIYIIDNTGVDASLSSIGYRLRSFSCGDNDSRKTSVLSDTHFTVFVEATVDSCNDLVNLSWTPYVGWNRSDENGIPIDSVVSYTVYTDTDTTIVPAPATNLAYSITPNTAEKCFQIVANNTSNLTSESNEVCVTREASNPPTDICLRVASIDTLNNRVELEWTIDLNSEITSLQLFGGFSPNALEQIGEISSSSPPATEIGDPVNINQGPYFYQIVHLDDCGRRVESNIGSTIFLNGRNQLDGSNLLSWTEFDIGEGAEINSYTIYRSENIPFKNFVPIQTLSNATFEFKDIVESGVGSTPSYCYYIAAQYNITCGDGTTVTELSQSNEVCVSQSPRIFVPNAFAPNGVNKVFKPIIKNPNPNDYKMVVFNRWGEHVFTTTDPDEGWNGFYKNRLAAQGVYAYYIRMQSELGFVLERKGTVVLIR